MTGFMLLPPHEKQNTEWLNTFLFYEVKDRQIKLVFVTLINERWLESSINIMGNG